MRDLSKSDGIMKNDDKQVMNKYIRFSYRRSFRLIHLETRNFIFLLKLPINSLLIDIMNFHFYYYSFFSFKLIYKNIELKHFRVTTYHTLDKVIIFLKIWLTEVVSLWRVID